MLAEMRKRQLGGKKSIAEEEKEYGNTHTHTYTQVMHLSPTHKKNTDFEKTLPTDQSLFHAAGRTQTRGVNFLMNRLKNSVLAQRKDIFANVHI